MNGPRPSSPQRRKANTTPPLIPSPLPNKHPPLPPIPIPHPQPLPLPSLPPRSPTTYPPPYTPHMFHHTIHNTLQQATSPFTTLLPPSPLWSLIPSHPIYSLPTSLGVVTPSPTLSPTPLFPPNRNVSPWTAILAKPTLMSTSKST